MIGVLNHNYILIDGRQCAQLSYCALAATY